MTTTEIEKRKPVWSALSEFYLDTELGEEEIKRIAEIFRASNYSIEELKEINCSEVGPVVYFNLFSTAGVWDQFDEEWLHEQIIKRLDKSKGNRFIGKLFRPFYRRLINHAYSNYWQAVKKEMKTNAI